MLSLPNELARRVLDATPDAMIIVDDSGSIRFANQQASALFGLSHDELIGKPVDDLIPERFRSRHSSLRREYSSNPRPRPMGVGLSLFGRRRDAAEFPIEISLTPIEAEGQRLFVAAIRDVTDRKRVEALLDAQLEDLRRLHGMGTRLLKATELPRMLEDVLDATVAMQQADFGSIQLYDPGTGTLKVMAHRGFSADCLKYFASIDRDNPSAAGRALRSGKRVIIEDVEEDIGYLPHRAIAAHEGYRAVQSTPILGRDGTVIGICSTQFRAPHRPSEHDLQLTDLYMRQVSDAISRAQDEDAVRATAELANRASQAKSRFLATASHDLRQPLQALSLLNGALRRSLANSTSNEALLQQEQAITSMSRLINALLDISRLESGTIDTHPIDFTLGALFGELRQEFAGLAGYKGLGFEVPSCEESVHSDPALVEQILRNLVANAIKYTRAGRVQLRCFAREPSSVRIEVLDTGIGIPAEQLRYIFDEFYQVGVSSTTTREGYGLGLSIVQRLVTLLGIKLEVESEVSKGSMFALILPAGQGTTCPARRIGAEPATNTNHAGIRVLLVEDDVGVRSAAKMLLTCEGYKVASVSTAAEALEQARTDPGIDLLVTDYHLGEGDTGARLITALRVALARPLRAVLISGDTSPAVKEIQGDPLLRFVSKPIQADELLTMVRALMDS